MEDGSRRCVDDTFMFAGLDGFAGLLLSTDREHSLNGADDIRSTIMFVVQEKAGDDRVRAGQEGNGDGDDVLDRARKPFESGAVSRKNELGEP